MSTQGDNNFSCHIVKQALSFETPDRLPGFDGYYPEWQEAWQKKHGFSEDVAAFDYFDNDLMVPVADETFWPSDRGEIERQDPYVLVDDGWGRIVKTRPGTYFSEPVRRRLEKPEDLDRLEFEPADLDSRYDGLLKRVADGRSRGRAVFVKVGGVFIRSSFFRGETEFLMDLAADKEFASALAARVGEHLTQIGLESLRRADTYDTGVWVFDDMCNVNSPMFSPRVFERIFLPIYKKMISRFKSAGARWVILHCDGNLLPLIDLLLEAGFDGINPVERNAGLIVEELVPKYHGRLSFIGGVCNAHCLPSGDKEKISRQVEAIVDAGRQGGLVIGTHSIGPDVPVEAYEHYREIVANRGNYKGIGI